MDVKDSKALLKVLGVMLDSEQSFDKKLDELLRIILKRMKSERGSLMILEGDSLVVKASTRAELVGSKQKLSDRTISSFAFRAKRMVRIRDIKNTPEMIALMRYPEKVNEMEFITAPIMARQGVIGIFNVSGRAGGDRYTTSEANSLTKWVMRISPIVENVKLTNDYLEEKSKLKKANDQLKKLEEMKRDLVNMVVHDMKSPLSEISANMDLLSASGLDELSASYLESAMIGARDLQRMVGNLLDINRMEEGRMELNLETVAVRDVLTSVVQRHRAVFELNELQAEVEIEGEEAGLTADKGVLERILANLLTNAAVHSPMSGQVRARALFAPDSDKVEFQVIDQGRGVPMEAQKKIFRKFYQVESGRGRGGSGLGLAFCDMAVKAHKGKIWVESGPDQGSCFAFHLPLGGPGTKRGRKNKTKSSE